MAAELKEAFNVDANLIEGSGGIFEVFVDGTNVFSKEKEDRFPEPGEVTGLLKNA